MKKAISLSIFTSLLLVAGVCFAQSKNWADYGLSEDDLQYLTQEQKDSILKTPTPEQTKQKAIEEIEKTGSTSIPFFKKTDVNSNTNESVASCFDYYTFGSVEADISSETTQVVSGMNMEFTGNLQNNNKYPVVEGTYYVKILKSRGVEKDANGPEVVDQFIVLDNISIPANASIPVSFSWHIPAYAQSGEYQVASYFTSDKKFNLLGLSFTDDIVGNTFNFSVSGENSRVFFAKDSVVINNNPYFFAAYPPQIEKNKDAQIYADISNTTKDVQTVKTKWKLYKWDAMNPSNLVREFETETVISPNSSKGVSVIVPEKIEPVYLLVGELEYKDTKSIVNIRFVRDEVDKVRLNFPSLTSYPIKKGEETTLFTCIHNAGQSSIVENNRVVLEIKDSKGHKIESYEYNGPVTGEMMIIKKDFTSKSNLDTFSVFASVYTNGVLVDQSEMKYDCKLIDPSSCNKINWKVIGGILVGILLLAGVSFIGKKIKNKRKIITPLVVLFFASGLFLIPHISEAKSTIWSKTVLKDFDYFWDISDRAYGVYGSGWELALSDPSINVNYNAEVKNLDTGSVVSSGDSIAVGTRLRFSFLKHKYTDVSWFGTGYSQDSPYGSWKEGAAPTVDITCRDRDYVGYETGSRSGVGTLRWDIYIPLSLDYPTKTLTGKSNMSCGSMTGNEDNGFYVDCTVTSTGALNPQFNFGATTGKFYYRYSETKVSTNEYYGCYGNNIPLKVDGDTYVLNIPAKTIAYTFTAFNPPPANHAPNAPTITGNTTGFVGTNYSFGFRATDQDADMVSYGVDWDGNGVVDQWVPSSGRVNSGVTSTTTKSWSTTGVKTFKALTKDDNSALSTWTSYSITLSNAPINGSCGSSPDICIMGSSTPEADTSTDYKWSCAGLYGGSNSSCSVSKGSFACSPSGSVVIVPDDVTYTATAVSGATYKWYVGTASNKTLISGASSNTYTKRYDDISQDTQIYVEALDNGVVVNTDQCDAVNLDCGTPAPESSCDPDTNQKTVYSFNNKCDVLTTTVSCSVDEVDAHFSIDPNTENSLGFCKFTVQSVNASSCTLQNRSGGTVWTGTSAANADIGVGTYTLSCSDLNGNNKSFVTRSCYSNPSVKEN